jgi:AraC family transcriptional regulator, regulatory protein of adaptative response / methylated-DNA-[protein]-cysteine methyltransferase
VRATPIRYCLTTCDLGRLLVAATERGICLVDFVDGHAAPRERLAAVFPFAEFCPAADGEPARAWAERIAGYVNGRSERIDVPLDVRGSQFQKRVWAALRRIPRGQTRAYSEIAKQVGRPRGARAVAQACAANPTAVVTPCHRVIEKSGGLGGYARGVARKRKLLELEGAL